jgi:hypothetical protein
MQWRLVGVRYSGELERSEQIDSFSGGHARPRAPAWVLPTWLHEFQERWIVAQGLEVHIRVDVCVA